MAKKNSDLPSTEKGKIQKWLELRLIINKAEPLKKALQPYVEKWLKKSPDKLRQFGTSTLTLTENVEKPYFDVDAAEEQLGKEVLAPFWRMSTHNRINVK